MIIFLLIVFVIVLVSILLTAIEDHMVEKERKNDRIEYLKKEVTSEFESIERTSTVFGEEYATKLLEFANKMDKISSNDDIKDDLKPYDRMGRENICRSKRHWGIITIDKNLKPKFMCSYFNGVDDAEKDIELEAALDSDGVRALAEKCKKTKLDCDIEKFRKHKIENFIK